MKNKSQYNPLPLLIVFATFGLLAYLVYRIISDEHKCDKLNGKMVRGICINKSVIIDV